MEFNEALSDNDSDNFYHGDGGQNPHFNQKLEFFNN